MGVEAVKSAMRRAQAKAKLTTKSRPWKSLRATFATRANERGVPVPTIAKLMGLSTAHVLEHYIRPSDEHLEDSMSDEMLHHGLHGLSANNSNSA